MNERIWDKFLTGRDKTVSTAGGFGPGRDSASDRRCLIDVNWAFSGERPEPILESINLARASTR
jgi:hypothetical protein